MTNSPFSDLSSLAKAAPLRVLLVAAVSEHSLTLSGLVEPLRLAEREAGRERLQLEVATIGRFLSQPPGVELAHLTLLVADPERLPQDEGTAASLLLLCQRSPAWGAVGGAVLWMARRDALRGARTALPWDRYPEVDEVAEQAILTPRLYEIDANRLTCCGGAASIDFGLTLVDALCGPTVQAAVKESMCVERVRGPGERQRVALQARFGELQPKLSDAVALMEANLEEPLSTDDIANLVGISRRQLERQFKQYLGSVPSRYYLELRLQKARQLLLHSHHSIVQVGLSCGFSSSSHFSTAYGTLFGLTPRDERQRKLSPVLG